MRYNFLYNTQFRVEMPHKLFSLSSYLVQTLLWLHSSHLLQDFVWNHRHEFSIQPSIINKVKRAKWDVDESCEHTNVKQKQQAVLLRRSIIIKDEWNKVNIKMDMIILIRTISFSISSFGWEGSALMTPDQLANLIWKKRTKKRKELIRCKTVFQSVDVLTMTR